jgi:hypothetical protein
MNPDLLIDWRKSVMSDSADGTRLNELCKARVHADARGVWFIL